jgi:O-antigen ligase
VGFSDNFFADMIVETGVPGVLMLTTLLVGMLAGAVRLARRAVDPAVMASSAAVAGLLFAIVAMSWGSQPLLGNPITAWFWFLGGLLAALRRMETEARVDEPLEAPAIQGVA